MKRDRTEWQFWQPLVSRLTAEESAEIMAAEEAEARVRRSMMIMQMQQEQQQAHASQSMLGLSGTSVSSLGLGCDPGCSAGVLRDGELGLTRVDHVFHWCVTPRPVHGLTLCGDPQGGEAGSGPTQEAPRPKHHRPEHACIPNAPGTAAVKASTGCRLVKVKCYFQLCDERSPSHACRSARRVPESTARGSHLGSPFSSWREGGTARCAAHARRAELPAYVGTRDIHSREPHNALFDRRASTFAIDPERYR